mmetsp:Transcript_35993/g.107521  ORF Transcript_35993/g.107521 Transcript_35993/m.107521 type:complete len:260 (+) Transcript_35993:577-1356(+)
MRCDEPPLGHHGHSPGAHARGAPGRAVGHDPSQARCLPPPVSGSAPEGVGGAQRPGRRRSRGAGPHLARVLGRLFPGLGCHVDRKGQPHPLRDAARHLHHHALRVSAILGQEAGAQDAAGSAVLGVRGGGEGAQVPRERPRGDHGGWRRLLVAAIRHQLPADPLDLHGLAPGHGGVPRHHWLYGGLLCLPHGPQVRGALRRVVALDACDPPLRPRAEAWRGLALVHVHLLPSAVPRAVPESVDFARYVGRGGHACHCPG